MRTALSVGARWTLRYSLAVLVTVSLLGVLVYDRVERRIRQDAALLLEHQAKEISRGIQRHRNDRVALDGFLAQKIEVGEHMVGLGIALHDADGKLLRAVGSMAATHLIVPEELLQDVRDDVSYEADLGRSYPHFVTSHAMPGGYLQVAIYSRPFVRRADHIVKVFRWSIPVLLLITAGVGFWLARSSLRPIADMTGAARRISAAHLEETVPSSGTGDELDQLAETLNEMLGRIRRGVERTRRFSVDASRELRTPLVALRRQIQDMLSREGLPEWHRRELRHAQEEADALAEAVHAMLRLAWSEEDPASERRVAVPVDSLLANAVDSCEVEAQDQGVELRRLAFPAVSVLGDPFRLHQLFVSLLDAAHRATPGGGWVEVDGREEAGRLHVTLRRSDPKEDPLAGAIRAVAREILGSHGGSLEILEGGGDDARTIVTLPILSDEVVERGSKR